MKVTQEKAKWMNSHGRGKKRRKGCVSEGFGRRETRRSPIEGQIRRAAHPAMTHVAVTVTLDAAEASQETRSTAALKIVTLSPDAEPTMSRKTKDSSSCMTAAAHGRLLHR